MLKTHLLILFSLGAKFKREGHYNNKIEGAQAEITALQEQMDDIDIQIDELDKFQP